ncbi:MAG: LPS assembly protein LptD [Candidatus Aminicenantes bacterium]|jgi:lipopolysaccharide assembly outer membrane protein LptD (OstA)
MKQKFLFLILFILAIGWGYAKIKSGYPITIKAANRQEVAGDKFIASGNVEIAWKEYRIYTDYLEFNTKTNELYAVGRVTMASKETIISGDQFRFDLNRKTGEMMDTYGLLSPTLRYTTDRLTQVDRETFTFKKMNFTPCAQCMPRWKITCANGKIKKEKYIEMKHVLFKIKKIPVMYLPYLRYPLKRSSGFLFPRMGKSSQKGFYILNGFYWVIKPNVDLSLGLDYYARSGLGIGNELRYLFRNAEGNIKFYNFIYKETYKLKENEQPDTEGNSTNQWKPGRDFDYFIKMTHKQEIDLLNTSITIEIDKHSDPNFLRSFSDNLDNIQTLKYRSSFSTHSSLSKLKLSMSVSENDTFKPSKNKSDIVRYLPVVELNLNQQKLWKLPGYFSLSASYTDKHWGEKSYQVKSTAEDMQEPGEEITSTFLRLTPTYTLRVLNAPWVKGNLSLKYHHSYYLRSQDPEAEELVILDEPLYLQHQTVDFTLKGPIFFRIFEFKSSKMKHIIEPQITTRYATRVDQDNISRLIKKDNFSLPGYSYVRLGLSTRLLYKSNKASTSAREILSYTITQDYYFDPKLANKNRTVIDIYPEFSQLENKLRLRPLQDFSIDARMNYNYYLKKFTYTSFSLDYKNKKSILNGSIHYTRTINQYKYKIDIQSNEPEPDENQDSTTGTNSNITTETIGGSLKFDKKGFPLKLSSRVAYNIKEGNFTYGSLLLSYDYQCIIFNVKFNVFKLNERLETRFGFGISFGNLGMVENLL